MEQLGHWNLVMQLGRQHRERIKLKRPKDLRNTKEKNLKNLIFVTRALMVHRKSMTTSGKVFALISDNIIQGGSYLIAKTTTLSTEFLFVIIKVNESSLGHQSRPVIACKSRILWTSHTSDFPGEEPKSFASAHYLYQGRIF